MACGTEGAGDLFRDCFPLNLKQPLGHDRGGAGFGFGTAFLRPSTSTIAVRKPHFDTFYDEPDPYEEEVEREPEPDYSLETVEFNYPSFSLPYEPMPHNPPLKDLPRKRVHTPRPRVNGPFVVRMVPQAPCYHCETGPKAGGGIPPWRQFS